jgi:hypothetical protein
VLAGAGGNSAAGTFTGRAGNSGSEEMRIGSFRYLRYGDLSTVSPFLR